MANKCEIAGCSEEVSDTGRKVEGGLKKSLCDKHLDGLAEVRN